MPSPNIPKMAISGEEPGWWNHLATRRPLSFGGGGEVEVVEEVVEVVKKVELEMEATSGQMTSGLCIISRCNVIKAPAFKMPNKKPPEYL